MSTNSQNVPIDAHVYEIWANGGVDPWHSDDLNSVTATFLCYGPRGCGKTFLASAFFEASGRTPLQLDAVDLLKNPDANLPKVFRSVLQTPRCGLLIEDIDSLFANLRSYPSARQFLLDHLKNPGPCVIFATAARPDDMQPNELDVFTYILPVFYGDSTLREVMMVAHAEHVPLNYDVDLSELSEFTEWWSGRDLMELMVNSPVNEEGVLTRASLIRQVKLKSSNIVPEIRAKRMRELLMFTANHSTSKGIREEIEYRFGSEFIVPSDKVPVTIQIGEVYVSQNQQFNIKQAGVLVTGGKAENVNVTQSLNESAADIDLLKLAEELGVLVRKLQSDSTVSETKTQAIQAVTEAKTEAEKGNGAGALASLSKVGTWVFKTATEIGIHVAAEAIKKSLGLGSAG